MTSRGKIIDVMMCRYDFAESSWLVFGYTRGRAAPTIQFQTRYLRSVTDWLVQNLVRDELGAFPRVLVGVIASCLHVTAVRHDAPPRYDLPNGDPMPLKDALPLITRYLQLLEGGT